MTKSTMKNKSINKEGCNGLPKVIINRIVIVFILLLISTSSFSQNIYKSKFEMPHIGVAFGTTFDKHYMVEPFCIYNDVYLGFTASFQMGVKQKSTVYSNINWDKFKGDPISGNKYTNIYTFNIGYNTKPIIIGMGAGFVYHKEYINCYYYTHILGENRHYSISRTNEVTAEMKLFIKYDLIMNQFFHIYPSFQYSVFSGFGASIGISI